MEKCLLIVLKIHENVVMFLEQRAMVLRFSFGSGDRILASHLKGL